MDMIRHRLINIHKHGQPVKVGSFYLHQVCVCVHAHYVYHKHYLFILSPFHFELFHLSTLTSGGVLRVHNWGISETGALQHAMHSRCLTRSCTPQVNQRCVDLTSWAAECCMQAAECKPPLYCVYFTLVILRSKMLCVWYSTLQHSVNRRCLTTTVCKRAPSVCSMWPR